MNFKAYITIIYIDYAVGYLEESERNFTYEINQGLLSFIFSIKRFFCTGRVSTQQLLITDTDLYEFIDGVFTKK